MTWSNTTRFEVTHDPQNIRYGIYDHKRRTYQPDTFQHAAHAEREAQRLEVERAGTWGTVVHCKATPTEKRPHRRHTVTRTGDIIAHDGQTVTIIDMVRRTVAIPAADVLEVLYGTVVRGVRPILRGRHAGGVTTVPGDIAGWTPDRHTELRNAVAGRSVPQWFGEFMRRYALSRGVTRSHTPTGKIIMDVGPTAEAVLQDWDDEHPEQCDFHASG